MTKHTYTYKTVGDCQIQTDVYRPDVGGTRPVIVWIHGGALICGPSEGISAGKFERYGSAGYTLVSIDYRLAPDTKIPGIIEDLRDAFRWIRAQAEPFGIDPDRLAVIGHSAGGYLTLMSGCCVQ